MAPKLHALGLFVFSFRPDAGDPTLKDPGNGIELIGTARAA